MKNIFQIYKTDLLNIAKVPTALLLMIALAILPSVYAWINLKAMWDPYGHTSGIKIAVTSKDTGATIQDKPFNVGDEVIQSLKENHKLGWTFVDENDALHGVENGTYYASLLIPEDFSRKIATVVEGNIQKPEILYTVNEKINAVAPKITEKGASSVTAQISENFIKTVSETVLTRLKEMGFKFEQQLPTIRKIENRILELEARLPEIEEMGKKVLSIEQKLPNFRGKGDKIVEIEQKIPEINKAGAIILKIESQWSKINEVANELLVIQGKFPKIQKASDRLTELNQNFDKIVAAMNKAIADVRKAETIVGNAISQLPKDEAIASENPEVLKSKATDAKASLQDAQTGIRSAQTELDTLLKNLPQIHTEISNAIGSIQGKLNDFTAAVNEAAPFIKNELPDVERKVHQAADFIQNSLPALEEELRTLSNLYQTRFLELENAVHQLASLVKNNLPEFEKVIHQAADQIRRLEEGNSISTLLQFLQKDIGKESDFLSNPVLIKEDKKYPIPNYGSAMSPFYTTLALWVGAMLLVSLLRADVEGGEGVYKNFEIYFGRLGIFLTLGFLQALIVSLGDFFILGTYTVHKFWFVIFAILISNVFITITYTLVSVFGNIGKGLAIIFLVLQFSSSGGTFPVSTASSFFQKLNPFMPFTYAVGVLREAVGGILLEVVITDVLILVMFILICYVLALALKKPLSGYTKRIAEKARLTKLIP